MVRSVSSWADMEHATLDRAMQDRLKAYVLGAKIEGPSKFPVSIIQISTRGEIHNHSPYVDSKMFFDPDNEDRDPLKIVRLFIDGLIFHVHLPPIPEDHLKDNPVFLGASDHLLGLRPRNRGAVTGAMACCLLTRMFTVILNRPKTKIANGWARRVSAGHQPTNRDRT